MPDLSRRALLAGAGLLAAGAARAANPQPQQAAPPPPVIGAALPLSGDLSLIGDECLRGIRLAADATDQAGGIAGKPVALVSADASNPAQATASVNGLITASHAGLVLSGGASDLSFPGSAAAELAQVPFIELNAPAAGITTRGFHFLLRTAPTTTTIGNFAARTIQERFAGRKIGLLYNTGATGAAIAAAATAALKNANLTIQLAIGYAPDVADLFAPAGRLKRAGAEIVLHAAGPHDVLAFFLAMRGQAWKPAALLGCGDGYALRETGAALGPLFEGTLVVAAPFYPPAAAAVADAYQRRYGMAPRGPQSLAAYVGAKLVFDTLGTVRGDPAKLLDALRATDIAQGGLANGWGVAFDHDGQNTRSFVALQQWNGTDLVPVG
ncbi:MAG TPA: ABC transporter substrate-binding protein [Acidocella sp.]|jgi:branched-chain amino acid transport system substrate-binding protein|uniref:ABC transporter substrate-binding protein n=1 Tax=Acidocella sp. TaxID=50710 RepID=UPI002B63BDA8|nr:ABC transporter substrate-binding protein [Acidocella sp.]HVE22946.1 ABC transporter substrate-binding protein [Acidocella sp.]